VLLRLKPDGPATARLAFPAAEVIEVVTADRRHRIEATLSADGLTLTVPEPGPVEVIRGEDLFPPKGAPHGYRHRASDPERNLLYRPGRWFHDRNVEVTYRRRENRPAPVTTAGSLPRTLARLRAGKALTLGVSGDSISTGLDASALSNAPPNQPGYPDLVAAQLRAAFGGAVTLKNRAVSGWSVANGVADLDKLLAEKPDLVVVAYGMNDVGRRDSKWFGGQTKTVIERVRAALPTAEVILVSPMLGHAEWVHTPRAMFAKYRDELRALAGPGVALADVTAVWEAMLRHKHDLDLTGNGLNHPNDFGHRLYAQAVLSLLGGWTRLPPLPDRQGFAAPFAGVSGGALVVAGGANFPDKKPWEGGKKVWYDTVFVLERPDGAWKVAGRLPRPLGYGVSVTHGGGVVCVGGSDADRHHAEAFRLEWKGGKVVHSPLPPLPCPVANGCGALVGDTLTVVGGLESPDAVKASSRAFAIDLAAATPAWREVAAY
ncbi:MAG: GDSL-type esterase/lipase family protein, partial [Gemmataceae bacterium]